MSRRRTILIATEEVNKKTTPSVSQMELEGFLGFAISLHCCEITNRTFLFGIFVDGAADDAESPTVRTFSCPDFAQWQILTWVHTFLAHRRDRIAPI
jgi:hypothetical protein